MCRHGTTTALIHRNFGQGYPNHPTTIHKWVEIGCAGGGSGGETSTYKYQRWLGPKTADILIYIGKYLSYPPILKVISTLPPFHIYPINLLRTHAIEYFARSNAPGTKNSALDATVAMPTVAMLTVAMLTVAMPAMLAVALTATSTTHFNINALT